MREIEGGGWERACYSRISLSVLRWIDQIRDIWILLFFASIFILSVHRYSLHKCDSPYPLALQWRFALSPWEGNGGGRRSASEGAGAIKSGCCAKYNDRCSPGAGWRSHPVIYPDSRLPSPSRRHLRRQLSPLILEAAARLGRVASRCLASPSPLCHRLSRPESRLPGCTIPTRSGSRSSSVLILLWR